MKHHFQIQEQFKSIEREILSFIDNFDNEGESIYKGTRNELKVKPIGNLKVNIKRFKKPHLVNQIAYRWFRKSKAERSYLFANLLLEKQVGTPLPLAYQVNFTSFGIGKSYYVSVQQAHDLTYRELIHNPNYPNREKILRAFTQFTFHFHNQGVFFLDHSPGNTLIEIKQDGTYGFYLVDLNRMQFKVLTYEERLRNFARLTPKKEMYRIMADEYAKLIQKDPKQVFEQIWSEVEAFRTKFNKKHELKSKLRFWK
ncbi:Kdo domain containing protein [Psychroflexus planctonicus]|uniref:Kdo domain containing protein n=1 Tax=Psychroflexus planctonicus TaxID=1526575 RepID=A0ABQ1SHP1_9FLAO|nr:Kdo domain containing protein [Psychroflexus planctonicus]GGE35634.1 hypothetical protein GCM10010832_14760 [Psychroflexus planctonicus]